jgi:hypothetical protein
MFLRMAVWLTVSALLTGLSTAGPLPRSVLIIDQLEPGTPFFAGFLDAFRSTLNASSLTPVSYYPEHLDFGRFSGPEYEKIFCAAIFGESIPKDPLRPSW